jgi:cyclophilin family peptidyl-prolyl cis-trans isomerase
MKRPARASSGSALLALLLVLPSAAQEIAPSAPSLLVPVGAAPVLDGKVGEEEWKGSASFEVLRGTEPFGRGRIRRAGRQLYFAFDSKISPWGLGIRLTFTDPVSGRSNLVLVTPVNPPRPPLAAFRHLIGRDPESVSAASGDIRFDLTRREGFACEVRLPLDLLEIVATEKDYAFSLEMWGLDQERTIAVYPQEERAATTHVTPLALRSEGAWGAADAQEKAPPGNEGLLLLEDLEKVTEGGPLFPRAAGWADGKRKDATLADFEARAARAAAACPDLISVRTFLIQARIARNDFAGALKALDELGAFLPPLSGTSRHLLIRMQILRDVGRYDEALETLTSRAADLEGDPAAARETVVCKDLCEAWRIEQEIRKGEALRDDLPRVLLKTTKGDLVLELFEDDAPNGVANFISLVESGFYDGTRFHWADGGGRVVGGDPNSKDDDPHNDGYGGPGYMIEPEPGRRLTFPMTVGYADKRRERRAEGSAFVIHLSPFPLADGVNTTLGRVISGEDVAMRLEHYDTLEKASVLRKRSHPYTPVKR